MSRSFNKVLLKAWVVSFGLVVTNSLAIAIAPILPNIFWKTFGKEVSCREVKSGEKPYVELKMYCYENGKLICVKTLKLCEKCVLALLP